MKLELSNSPIPACIWHCKELSWHFSSEPVCLSTEYECGVFGVSGSGKRFRRGSLHDGLNVGEGDQREGDSLGDRWVLFIVLFEVLT